MLILLFFCNAAVAMSVSGYLQLYKTTGNTDYQVEKQIIESYKFKDLVTELSGFYKDSLPLIRQKAYYLTYKKGSSGKKNIKTEAVSILVKGCKDKSGSVVGQNISFLQEFSPLAFNEQAKATINELLIKRQMSHFKSLVLLAGYIGTGQELMKKKLLQEETSRERKWAYSLALARMGDEDRISFCVAKVKQMPLNNNTVEFLIPELVYMRKKQAIAYCIEIISSNEKACFSPNPDKPQEILCGYRVMELIAPVIVDFPFNTDATGSIDTNDYEGALKSVRNWFEEQQDYLINNNIF